MPKIPSHQIYLLKNPYPFPKKPFLFLLFCKQTLHHLNLIINKPMHLSSRPKIFLKIITKPFLFQKNLQTSP